MNIIEKSFKMIISCLIMAKYKIIYRRNFKCNLSDMISSSIKIRISDGGKVIIGKRVGLRDNIIINSTGGTIIIEDKVFINDYSCINSRNKLTIGSGTVIGQGVKMYDHDHDYKKDLHKDFICSPILIGSNVWIGSESVVLKGVKIGSNSVIGAMTLVKEDVPESVVFVNERTTKQFIIKKSNNPI